MIANQRQPFTFKCQHNQNWWDANIWHLIHPWDALLADSKLPLVSLIEQVVQSIELQDLSTGVVTVGIDFGLLWNIFWEWQLLRVTWLTRIWDDHPRLGNWPKSQCPVARAISFRLLNLENDCYGSFLFGSSYLFFGCAPAMPFTRASVGLTIIIVRQAPACQECRRYVGDGG